MAKTTADKKALGAAARRLGIRGETIAADHYTALGYTVCKKNFRTRFGEVDLILKKNGVVIFCEVKTRGRGAIDTPAAWVNTQKQRRIILAAQQWLQNSRIYEPRARFDVAEVFMDDDLQTALRVNIIENAFTL